MPVTIAPARWGLPVCALLAAFALVSCGGSSDSGDEPVTSAEAVAAFEDAAAGHEFEKAISLVDGAVAYGPVSDPDPKVVEGLNESLGESSVLWQVLIFDGPEPPLDEEAVEAAAFASKKLKPVGEGVYIGDSDIAYIADGNVVVTGPVLDGDPDDETLKRWQAALGDL